VDYREPKIMSRRELRFALSHRSKLTPEQGAAIEAEHDHRAKRDATRARLRARLVTLDADAKLRP